ncbi:carbohydrate ABC transporter permease [Lactococcus allomyrinae]|uniref:Sugar ABC transporter permease n=1 Tax=Lactococcus allomyrinae TaxID=2419773 RepID=A0A387BC33_9LACT|nr:sugar ABC transporter permease [Lactococcus allomyrinae]AYG00008.1 sugar ABC transporter permease [Lactococcus allomyrinae]
MKNHKIGLLYIAPWIIGFLVLTIWPIIMSFYYSLTDYNMITTPSFIGLKNYMSLFQSSLVNPNSFTVSLRATIIYVIFSVPLQLVFALFVAFVLNFKIKGISFFRTAYYIPSILGGNVAVGILWRFMFNPTGLVNTFLGTFGIHSVDWLSTTAGAMFSIVLLKVWQFGSSMLIFLAALKNLPPDLYEVASLEGASKLQQFFKITIPLITPSIFFNLVMQISNAFQEFNGPYLVTQGGPLQTTNLASLFIYQQAFQRYNMGYASAASWVLFAIIVSITIILFATQRFWVYYSDGGND